MFEALLNSELLRQLLSVWEVFLYVGILVPALLLRRVKFCLLVSFMFTYYLAFLLYWGDYIERSPSALAFFAYLISGVAVVALVVVESFKEQASKKSKVSFQD